MVLEFKYCNQGFLTVGFHVELQFDNPQMNLEPPEIVDPNRILRSFNTKKPRITRHAIRIHKRGAPTPPPEFGALWL